MLQNKIKELRNSNNANVSNSTQKPLESLKTEIKILNNRDDIPTSRQGLLDLAKEKNSSLTRYLDINLSKKENKAIDLLCEYRFDIEDGYQTFKHRVEMAKKDIIDKLETALEEQYPETLILAYNPDNNYIYNMSNIDVELTIHKRSGFHQDVYTHGLEDEDEELEELGINHVSINQLDVISYLYSLCDLYVDIGFDDTGCGYGNQTQDLNEVKDVLGLYPADKSEFNYHSFTGNDRPYFVMIVSRPSNEAIKYMIEKIKNYN